MIRASNAAKAVNPDIMAKMLGGNLSWNRGTTASKTVKIPARRISRTLHALTRICFQFEIRVNIRASFQEPLKATEERRD